MQIKATDVAIRELGRLSAEKRNAFLRVFETIS